MDGYMDGQTDRRMEANDERMKDLLLITKNVSSTVEKDTTVSVDKRTLG